MAEACTQATQTEELEEEMNGIPYGWITWAALNAVTAAGASTGYETAHAAGLGTVSSGAVTLAADTRALLDLDSAYGPYTAVLGPVLATVASHLSSGHSAVPGAVSVGLMVLARTAAARRAAS
jgi:hypothetical protein